MKTKIPNYFLDKYKKMISDRYSLLFGQNYLNIINNHLNNVNNVFVVDTMNKRVRMSFVLDTKDIHINSEYFEFDNNNNPITFFKKEDLNQVHCLIHELLHASSDKKEYNGVVSSKNSSNVGINEGITQMYADDICGYVQNKYLKSYNELKIVAKVLRRTLGNDVIAKSYFSDSDELKKCVNMLSKDNNYCDKLLNSLTAINKIYCNGVNEIDKRKVFFDIIEKKYEIVLRDLIINIIIPYMIKLNNDEKKEYIKNLMLDIQDDDRIKRNFKSILKDYIDKSDLELGEEKNKLKLENEKLTKENYYMSVLSDENKSKNVYYVKENGDVCIANSSFTLASTLESSIVYSKLFDEYYNYDDKFYDMIIQKIEERKSINIKYKDIKTRRIVLCGIQKHLNERGYKLLNDYRELDNHYKIENPLLIKKGINPQMFDYLKKINDKYEAKLDKYNIIVIDKETGLKVEDEYIKSYAKLSDLWVKIFKTNDLKVVFSEYNKNYFRKCMRIIDDCFQSRNDLNVKYILSKCDDEFSKKIIMGLFYNPTRVEIIYDFLFNVAHVSKITQEKKAKSILEISDKDYNEKLAVHDSEVILK